MGNVMDSTVMTRYVELYILADDVLLASHGGDRGRVNQKIAGIVALMNSLYKPLNIEFLIAHVKVDERREEVEGGRSRRRRRRRKEEEEKGRRRS